MPALAAATGWTTVGFDQRGTQTVRQVWSRTLLWYHVTKDRPLLVVVRDPDGIQPDDFLITTDTDTDPAWVASHYARRWPIEVTFRDEKQHLGGQDPQCWKRLGPQRAARQSSTTHGATLHRNPLRSKLPAYTSAVIRAMGSPVDSANPRGDVAAGGARYPSGAEWSSRSWSRRSVRSGPIGRIVAERRDRWEIPRTDIGPRPDK